MIEAGINDAAAKSSARQKQISGVEGCDMKITAASLPRAQVLPRTGLTTRAPDFLVLMKPRVMFLAVFTAFAGSDVAAGLPRPHYSVRCDDGLATGAEAPRAY